MDASDGVQIVVRVPSETRDALKARAGARGVAPLIRSLIDAWLDGSGSAPSPEPPKPEPRRGGYPATRPAASVGPPPAGPAPGARQRCPHPKARRSRGQCLACMEHVG